MSRQERRMEIRDPLVIMFEAEGQIICHLHPSKRANSYEAYGLLICDLVRHVAKYFKVNDGAVWEWVDKERKHPTTDVTETS